MTAPGRAIVAVLTTALLLGACADQRATGDGRSQKRGSNPSTSSVAGTTATVVPTVPSSAASGAKRPGTQTSPASAAAQNALGIDVVMDECLERGRPATALIRTAPGTMLVASATYSDGQSYYNYWVGAADARGEYPVAWTPPPEAPLGKGKFLVGAQSDNGGNTAVKEFRLATIGSCS